MPEFEDGDNGGKPKKRRRIATAILAASIGAGGALGGAAVAGYATIRAERVHIAYEQQRAEQADAARKRAEAESAMYRQMFTAAPTKYWAVLDGQIQTAARDSRTPPPKPSSEGPAQPSPSDELRTDAIALIASRDAMAATLGDLGKQLDHEMDELKAELAKPKPDMAKVGMLVQVIQKEWPTKKATIEVEIRKLLAELGITQISSEPGNSSGAGSTP